jgi:hypothetical protein
MLLRLAAMSGIGLLNLFKAATAPWLSPTTSTADSLKTSGTSADACWRIGKNSSISLAVLDMRTSAFQSKPTSSNGGLPAALIVPPNQKSDAFEATSSRTRQGNHLRPFHAPSRSRNRWVVALASSGVGKTSSQEIFARIAWKSGQLYNEAGRTAGPMAIILPATLARSLDVTVSAWASSFRVASTFASLPSDTWNCCFVVSTTNPSQSPV